MYSLTDLCFLCLTHHQNIKNVNSEDTDGIVVEEKLRCFLSEIVNFKPEIPKTVCTNCLENVNFVYSFRQKCLQNVDALDDYLQKLSMESESHNHFLAPLIDHQQSKNEMETDDQDSDHFCNVNVKVEAVEPGEPDCKIEDYSDDKSEIKKEPEDTSDNEATGSDPTTEETPAKDTPEHFSHFYDFQDSYMDDDEEFNEESNTVQLHLLPEKSKDRYEKEYSTFIDWKKKNRVATITEDLMLEYFIEKSKSLKSSTLWSQYSMLKTTLVLKEHVNIGRFIKLKAFLRNQASGYKAKKPKSFTKDEIERFLNEAPDDAYLMIKAALIIGMTASCRRNDLVNMKVQDVQDRGDVIIVTTPDSKAKRNRATCITEPAWIHIIRNYMALRPPMIALTRFFLFYSNNKCTRQPVGIHSFGSMPSKIAKFLNLEHPEQYTGHCFRRSGAAVLSGP